MRLHWSFRRLGVAVLLAGVSAGAASGSDPTPVSNWAVWHDGRMIFSPESGVSKSVDLTSAVPFVPIQPCRVVDTRGGGVFTGAYGPPVMAANATRDFDINSAAHCPGIPAGAAAYSLNFTVTETAGSGGGDLRAWPQALPPVQVTSVLNWLTPGTTIANATIIPAGAAGAITVQVAGNNTHLLIDINGYFSTFMNPGNGLDVVTSAGGLPAIYGENQSTANDSYGLLGFVTATPGDSVGVGGFNGSTGGVGVGVYGQHAGAGTGVYGLAGGTSGASSRGVYGQTMSTTAGAVGVHGVAPAVAGIYGVFSTGDLGATGTKSFVEPHPTEPGKVIRYISLEGNEAGTYFRGRSKFERGQARIRVPEDFGMVTDAEGLTVQITPIGAMATFAVVKLDLSEIVVQGSRNVEFFYLVQGVRRSFRKHDPVTEGMEFVPESADSRLPETLPEEVRQRLIANGTYDADGRVNMTTAKALGWDLRWKETRSAARAQRAVPRKKG